MGLKGVTFYRLRHSFKTLGKNARDRESLDLMMGHRDASVGRIYDHETVSWKRIRRVSKVLYKGLWPKLKRSVKKKSKVVSLRGGGASVANGARV